MLQREVERRTDELKRMTDQLREERTRLISLLDGLPGIVFLQAPNRSIRFANRVFRETFGDPECMRCFRDRAELGVWCESCSGFPLFASSPLGEWNAPDGRIFQVYEYPFADADGSEATFRFALDITDRKRAELEILKRERIRAALELAGAASHELNQPLQILYGYCELMSESLNKESPFLECIRKINEQVERMSEITRKMNALIRYETKDYFNGAQIFDIFKSSE
jgi:signal transduction histidine kinase